jgi:hypothetical protein
LKTGIWLMSSSVRHCRREIKPSATACRLDHKPEALIVVFNLALRVI